MMIQSEYESNCKLFSFDPINQVNLFFFIQVIFNFSNVQFIVNIVAIS